MPKPVKEKKPTMQNITINIPDIYDVNIQKLIKLKIVPLRLGSSFTTNIKICNY
ncbi:MAG: hypothetical protein ACTSQT_00565 [Promethearchaeota archaeon]